MRYTDELDRIRAREAELRTAIAAAIGAEDAGLDEAGCLRAAEAAIASWSAEAEARDQRAFRPLSPLETLLAEHEAVVERIADTLDRRLS